MIDYCTRNNFVPVRLETDSLVLLNMVEGTWNTPSKLRMKIDRIRFWRAKGVSTVHHVLREGNKIADFITCCVGAISYNSLQQLPQEVQN